MSWFADELALLDRQNRLRRPLALDHHSATVAHLDNRSVRVFGSNDYLGLRYHPVVVGAAIEWLRSGPVGAGASRLISGSSEIHHRLEQALSQLLGTDAALVVPSGFAANTGAIAAIAGPGDAIFSDRLNHASIVDGCRLSGAKVHVFDHASTVDLERQLAAARPWRRGWVITESLFSMDGDCPPLADIDRIARANGLHLYVDEAHALGTTGPAGAGLCSTLGIRPTILVGTLGKSLGASGAFIAGDASTIHYLWNKARPHVFSTALAPVVAAAALAALQVLKSEPRLRDNLASNTHRLRAGLRMKGLVPGGANEAPIVPILVGSDSQAVALSAALLGDGYLVPPIRPPTVPEGSARLRITASAVHTHEEIDGLVESLARHA